MSSETEIAEVPATEASLTAGQVEKFQAEGFLALPSLITRREVDELRQIVGELFARKAGHEQGAHFNFAGAEEDDDAPSIFQIVAPNNFDSRLKKTRFRKIAAEWARQLLGPEARFQIDHTLMKPPIDGAATPWHQDEAFKNPCYDYREISIWMPLQPVDEVNGCMTFIPGSHRQGILRHGNPNNDPRIHAVECIEGFDPADAVSCPLPAGGCTIHGGRTLHAAGPNRSDQPRLAYVLIFHTPPEPAQHPKSFPWLKDKNTARMHRTKRWIQSGGKFMILWRVFRNKELNDYKRTFRKLKRRLFRARP